MIHDSQKLELSADQIRERAALDPYALAKEEEREARRAERDMLLRIREAQALAPQEPELVRRSGTPEQVAALYTALAEASGEFAELEKDREGQEGQKRYQYATMNALVRATRPALSKHKVIVLQHLIRANGKECVLTEVNGHGARIESSLDVPAGVRGDKGYGLVTTYLRRYAYQSLFQLDSAESDDLDSHQQDEAQEPHDYQRGYNQNQGGSNRSQAPTGPAQNRQGGTQSHGGHVDRSTLPQGQGGPRGQERAPYPPRQAETPRTAQGSAETKDSRMEAAKSLPGMTPAAALEKARPELEAQAAQANERVRAEAERKAAEIDQAAKRKESEDLEHQLRLASAKLERERELEAKAAQAQHNEKALNAQAPQSLVVPDDAGTLSKMVQVLVKERFGLSRAQIESMLIETLTKEEHLEQKATGKPSYAALVKVYSKLKPIVDAGPDEVTKYKLHLNHLVTTGGIQ